MCRIAPLIFFAALIAWSLLPGAALAQRLPVSEAVIMGRFAQGPVDVPVKVSATDTSRPFQSLNAMDWPAETQLRWFFENGGASATVIRVDPYKPLAAALRGQSSAPGLQGAGLLQLLPDAGILVMPELSGLPAAELLSVLETLRPLANARHFFLLLDPPASATTVTAITSWAATLPQNLDFVQLTFPRLLVDRQRLNASATPGTVPIGGSGACAAITIRQDAATGPWDPPSSQILVTSGVEVTLNNAQSDSLNLAHICPIRFFTGNGYRLFGTRSRDTIDTEKRYITINRLVRWTAHSLQRALAPTAAVTANNNTLWSSLRNQATSHLLGLFNNGALTGTTANEAFFVRCDATTSSSNDIANQRVNLLYGIATIQPAEFQITQLTFTTGGALRPDPDFTLIALRPSPALLDLYYPTKPGFSYNLETSLVPGAATWPVLSTTPGDGAWKRYPVSLTSGSRFYRVRAQ